MLLQKSTTYVFRSALYLAFHKPQTFETPPVHPIRVHSSPTPLHPSPRKKVRDLSQKVTYIHICIFRVRKKYTGKQLTYQLFEPYNIARDMAIALNSVR